MCGGGSSGSIGGASGTKTWPNGMPYSGQPQMPNNPGQGAGGPSYAGMNAVGAGPYSYGHQNWQPDPMPGGGQAWGQGMPQPGMPGTGDHLHDVWNPTKHHWTPNPTGATIPPEWRNHPGAYLYGLAHPHGGPPTPGPGTTPPPITPLPTQHWGSIDQQWAKFSSNPADWAPGTDMQQAKANFYAANGFDPSGSVMQQPYYDANGINYSG